MVHEEVYKLTPPFKKWLDRPYWLNSKILEGHPFSEELLLERIPDKRVKVLLEQCWAIDLKERPSMPEVVEKLQEIGGFDDIHNVYSDLRATMALLTPPKTPPNEINDLPDLMN
jgi:hypothetical protein